LPGSSFVTVCYPQTISFSECKVVPPRTKKSIHSITLRITMMNFNPIANRRQCLQHAACGFGALALQGMLHAAEKDTGARGLDFTPRAKRVIFLFMAGGPSQMDLFDPKEYISTKHGEAIDSPLDRNVTQIGTEKYLALGAMAPVKPRGQ